jgi:guanylate kinase
MMSNEASSLIEPTALIARRGGLFVLSGPSGVGKDMVLRELLASPNTLPKLSRVVTATTRPPRPGEVDGVDYHFLTRQEFLHLSRKGGFLETVEYAEELYGTPIEGIERLRETGTDAILKIEVRGAQAVRDRFDDAVLVFLAPPSRDELIARLMVRGTDDETTIEERLQIANEELEAARLYDFIVVNDYVSRAVDALRAVILAHRLRVVTENPDAE